MTASIPGNTIVAQRQKHFCGLAGLHTGSPVTNPLKKEKKKTKTTPLFGLKLEDLVQNFCKYPMLTSYLKTAKSQGVPLWPSGWDSGLSLP